MVDPLLIGAPLVPDAGRIGAGSKNLQVVTLVAHAKGALELFDIIEPRVLPTVVHLVVAVI